MNSRILALSACLLLSAAPVAAPAEPLRDIVHPLCSSVDADHAGDPADMSPNCKAPPVEGRHDRLEVSLRAARGEVTIGDYTIADAFLYNGQFVPEVWRLDAGDTLRVSFENALTGSGGDVSNLHTHGMIVSPNNAGGTDISKPLGDNVYVLVDNGKAAGHGHGQADPDGHIPIRQLERLADYAIPIPENHPSGLFWYHPHPHGLSGAQVGGGMSGLMTVGLPGDYVRLPDGAQEIEQRLLMLKDVQLARKPGDETWTVQDSANWSVCFDADRKQLRTIPGACLNGADTAWLFTVNGQLYPTIEIDEGRPQLWRLANVGANVSYRLQLVEIAADGSERVIPFQIVSVDGVAVGQSGQDGKMRRDELLMMPSARVEVYVAYGRAVGANGARAVLRQTGLHTGSRPDTGYYWPAIDLAEITFRPRANPSRQPAPTFIAVEKHTPHADVAASTRATDDGCPRLASDESRLVVFDVHHYAKDRRPSVDFAVPPGCKSVRYDNGYFFNIQGTAVARVDDESSLDAILATYDRAIGMKYAGTIAGRQAALRGKCFDASLDTCVPYPSVETWWVANASAEAHNFHIHQGRFQVLEVVGAGSDFTPNPNVHHDNYPVLTGQAIKVRVPFDRPEQIGTYVYHCHVLDHEDEGMMAAIEVRETPE